MPEERKEYILRSGTFNGALYDDKGEATGRKLYSQGDSVQLTAEQAVAFQDRFESKALRDARVAAEKEAAKAAEEAGKKLAEVNKKKAEEIAKAREAAEGELDGGPPRTISTNVAEAAAAGLAASEASKGHGVVDPTAAGGPLPPAVVRAQERLMDPGNMVQTVPKVAGGSDKDKPASSSSAGADKRKG